MTRRVSLLVALTLFASLLAVGPVGPVGAAPERPAQGATPVDVDPGVPGAMAVEELSYDLGSEAFQPEGLPGRVEVRAKVYAPVGLTGPAPLVIVQHGRHVTCATSADAVLRWPCPPSIPEVASYAGYDALGQNLASHGIIAVSIGANGINAADAYLDDGGASARAELIMEHLRLWRAWGGGDASGPFGDRFDGRVDLANVGLVGHSRGGEGIAVAVQLNQRIGAPYGIRSVVALAPVDFGRRVVSGVDLAVVLPYCDGDVSDLQGAAYYDDARYSSPGDPTSKASVLLYGANHNFFNTVWTSGPGSFDDMEPYFGERGPPGPCEPGGATRISAANQEVAGAVLVAGYLRRTLQQDEGLARFVTGAAPFPASTGPARWSIAFHAPQRLDVERWNSPTTARTNRAGQVLAAGGASSGLICNLTADRSIFEFPPGPGVTRTRCPSAGRVEAVNDTGVLDVGWVRGGSVVRQPLAVGGVDVTAYDGLRLRVAVPADSRNAIRARQDFTIVVEDATGARASVLASSASNGLARLSDGYVRHAVLNGVRVPLSAFVGIDRHRVTAVELRFDRTGGGRVALADLAFTLEGTGDATANVEGPANIAPPVPPCRGASTVRFGCALAQLTWGRDPTPDEAKVLGWNSTSAAGRQRAAARTVVTEEAARLISWQVAQVFTRADLDPAQIRSAMGSASTRGWEGVRVDVVVGLAYTSPDLRSPDRIVDAAYETLVGHGPDAAGRAYWISRVERDDLRSLAEALVRSPASRERIVDQRYRQILGHAPDPAGRAYWVRQMAQERGEQRLVTFLLASDSFRVAATR